MAKRFMQIILFTGLTAVLVIGAINRTQAKSPSFNDSGVEFSEHELDTDEQYYNQDSTHENTGNGKGRRRPTGGEFSSENFGKAESHGETVDLFTEEAVVTSANRESLKLLANNGDRFEIDGQPWVYALGQGFNPGSGSQISITGYYDLENHFKVTQLINLDNGESVVIRDASGISMWAGSGD